MLNIIEELIIYQQWLIKDVWWQSFMVVWFLIFHSIDYISDIKWQIPHIKPPCQYSDGCASDKHMKCSHVWNAPSRLILDVQGPLLLTWIKFNPNMDK